MQDMVVKKIYEHLEKNESIVLVKHRRLMKSVSTLIHCNK